MIDVHYASLTSQGVQHRVIYLDGHPSRYQPRPTGFNFGEQTGTGVFPLVIGVPQTTELRSGLCVLRIFHVDHVVRNSGNVLSLDWQGRFSYEGNEITIFCCALTR